MQVDLTYCELRRGDILLLCSDGLSGMVRFDEIRDALRSSVEPIEACKLLTERANQAGGHDNITVVVVRFDGEGLEPLVPGLEPLRYRKYTLPEEPVENTEPGRRVPSGLPVAPPAQREVTSGSNAPQGLRGTMALSATPVDPPQMPLPPMAHGARPPQPHPQSSDEERIDIPGTHVPPWVVVAIVLGVVVVLWAAFLLLS